MKNHLNKALLAAEAMDWMQPVLNDSPPCFHISDDGRFCGRAERWDGHKKSKGFPALHAFVSFKELMTSLRDAGWREGMEHAQRIIAPQNPHARSPNAEVRNMCMGEIRAHIRKSENDD